MAKKSKHSRSKRARLAEAEAKEDGVIATIDLRVAKKLHPYGESPVVEALGKASDLADQPPLVAASVLTLATGLALRKPSLTRTGARMLASHGLATLLKTLIKDRVDRTRPKKVEREGEHEIARGKSKDGEERSFPSGHSAGAAAVARAIVAENPGAAPIAYPLAGFAAGMQLPRKAHFLSDVVAGIAIGLIADRIIGWVMPKRHGDDSR